MSIDTATVIARLVREHGGRALVVGGWVRDRLLGQPGKDVDVEVYGLPAPRLKTLLATLAPVNTVGESFTVYKVLDVDHRVYKDTPQWREVLAAQKEDEWRALAPFYELVLNGWGKEGWELVGVERRDNRSTLFFLKRPRHD